MTRWEQWLVTLLALVALVLGWVGLFSADPTRQALGWGLLVCSMYLVLQVTRTLNKR